MNTSALRKQEVETMMTSSLKLYVPSMEKKALNLKLTHQKHHFGNFLVRFGHTSWRKLKSICRSVKHYFKDTLPRIFALAMMLMFMALDQVSAKGGGSVDLTTLGTGLDNAGSSFGDMVNNVENLLKGVAAAIAVVGAFTIFHKMQNGDQDVKKTVVMIVGGCVAFLVAAQALPALFGYSGA